MAFVCDVKNVSKRNACVTVPRPLGTHRMNEASNQMCFARHMDDLLVELHGADVGNVDGSVVLIQVAQ
jgi:hypothetical protein